MECFAKPPHIPPDSIFMNVKFEVRSSDHTVSYSELSGCVRKESLQEESPTEEEEGDGEEPTQEIDKGSWLSRMKEILPGDRFQTYRAEARVVWAQVERIIESASGLQQTKAAREDFYNFSKRQSQSYQNLLEKGLMSPEGERLVREIEHMKFKCRQAAHVISSSVLDSLFAKGEYTIYRHVIYIYISFSPPPPISSVMFIIDSMCADHLCRVVIGGELVPTIVKSNTLEAQVRLEEVKKRLKIKFETDIFALAEYLSSREAEAWERLNARFQDTDPAAVAEKMKQHEESFRKIAQDAAAAVSTSNPAEAVDNKKENDSETGQRGRDMRRGSSFGVRDGGRRRTMSPSQSFGRSGSKSPRPPVMRGHRSKSPRPGDHSRIDLSVAAPTSSEAPEDAKPVAEMRKNLRRSFTIQPVESFSAGSVEVVEINAENKPTQPGATSASSLSAILNLTNAAALASRRRLAERLSLQKSQKSREQDTGFMLHTIFEFEFLMFELLMTEKMTEYMRKEFDLLQSRLATTAMRAVEELALKHKKDTAHALTENVGEEALTAMKAEHQEEKTRLDSKLAEKKRSRRASFEDARAVTMEKLAAKLEKIREHGRVAQLSPFGVARIRHILQIFTTLRNDK